MKQKSKILDGINIQWPWSELLINGKKIIETRSYPLPERLIGVELAIIETPGPRGKKEAGISEAHITGTVTFVGSYRYMSERHWLAEYNMHLVSPNDRLFKFQKDKEKWAWTVGKVTKLQTPVIPPVKRGIIFAKKCEIPF